MKRIAALVLILCLALSASAFAEEEDSIVYSFSYYELLVNDSMSDLEGADYLDTLSVLLIMDASRQLADRGFVLEDMRDAYFLSGEDHVLYVLSDSEAWMILRVGDRFLADVMELSVSDADHAALMEEFAGASKSIVHSVDMENGMDHLSDILQGSGDSAP